MPERKELRHGGAASSPQQSRESALLWNVPPFVPPKQAARNAYVDYSQCRFIIVMT